MIHEKLEGWHRVVSERNVTGLADLLSDDVIFFSPVVHSPQQGKKTTIRYLSAAFLVLGGEKFSYVREVVSETDAVLEFTAEIGGIQINGVDMIHWNEEGLIDSFKVMIRPLKAVNLVHSLMGELLSQSKAREG